MDRPFLGAVGLLTVWVAACSGGGDSTADASIAPPDASVLPDAPPPPDAYRNPDAEPPVAADAAPDAAPIDAAPSADRWGLACFDTLDCASFCAGTSCLCDAFLGSIGLASTAAQCFFDCMDGSAQVGVADCRTTCGASDVAPACETGVAGAGGWNGVVTGPGACTQVGFTASVSLGGSLGELRRVAVAFPEAIDEGSVFGLVPPTCPATAPLTDTSRFRVQLGAAPPAAMCERHGLPQTVCKSTAAPNAYQVAFATPVCTPSAVDVSVFMSCHAETAAGGSYLHYSTGDYFITTSWPPAP